MEIENRIYIYLFLKPKKYIVFWSVQIKWTLGLSLAKTFY